MPRIIIFGLAAVFLVSALLPAQSAAQEPVEKIIKFGVVSIDEVTRQSLLSKDIARQIAAKRTAFREEIKREEDALRKADEELRRQRVLLSPEAFQVEARKFDTKRNELQRKVQERNQQLNQIRALGTRTFNAELQKTLNTVAKEQNFTLILRRREVLVQAKFLDLTPVILARLNKDKPSHKLPDEIPAPGR